MAEAEEMAVEMETGGAGVGWDKDAPGNRERFMFGRVDQNEK